MENNEKSAAYKLAEKSVAATLVSTGAGIIGGFCVTKTVEDVLDNVMPEQVSIGAKVAYGIGSSCIGAFAGKVIADEIEKEMMETTGVVLAVKSGMNALGELFGRN